MSRNSYHTNSDGLTRGYGTRTSEKGTAAKVSKGGSVEELVLDIVGTDLEDASIPSNYSQSARIPSGSLLLEAELIVDVAFTSGGSAVLDLGTYDTDGDAIDDDGIDAAIAVGALTADTYIGCDGAQIGTVLTEDAIVAATYDTAAFTAGTAKLVVRYIKQ